MSAQWLSIILHHFTFIAPYVMSCHRICTALQDIFLDSLLGPIAVKRIDLICFRRRLRCYPCLLRMIHEVNRWRCYNWPDCVVFQNIGPPVYTSEFCVIQHCTGLEFDERRISLDRIVNFQVQFLLPKSTYCSHADRNIFHA